MPFDIKGWMGIVVVFVIVVVAIIAAPAIQKKLPKQLGG